jgi:hypothetical protein
MIYTLYVVHCCTVANNSLLEETGQEQFFFRQNCSNSVYVFVLRKDGQKRPLTVTLINQ